MRLPAQFYDSYQPSARLPANASEAIWKTIGGLILGTICIVGGLVLLLHGIGGKTSWTTSFLGMGSKVTDAAPGAVFAILGFFIIYVTRYDIGVAGSNASRKRAPNAPEPHPPVGTFVADSAPLRKRARRK